MSDALHGLLSSGRHAALSPEALELMGKKAANLFLSEKVALNEGVAKLAAAHHDINAEQIKRVCEFANTAVYLSLHDKNKTAQASSSYPQFSLADPGRVIQDLSDGAKPTVITPTDTDYGQQPLKSSRATPGSELSLEELFGVKTSSIEHTGRQQAWLEIGQARDTLIALKDNLTNSAQTLNSMHKEASDVFYDMTKRFLLDGGSLGDVLNAAKSSGHEEEKVASVMQPFVERWMEEEVMDVFILEQGADEMMKVAHRIVNTEHPMVRTFKAVADLDVEIHKVAAALEDVSENEGRVKTFIKENFRESSAR